MQNQTVKQRKAFLGYRHVQCCENCGNRIKSCTFCYKIEGEVKRYGMRNEWSGK